MFFQTNVFRTIDGKCNNLENPLWGSRTIAMRRILPSITDLFKVDQYFTSDLGKINIIFEYDESFIHLFDGVFNQYFLCLVGLPCVDDFRFARFCPGWKHNCNNGTTGYFMSKYCRETCNTCNNGGKKIHFSWETFFYSY